jgi:hypothetical protein
MQFVTKSPDQSVLLPNIGWIASSAALMPATPTTPNTHNIGLSPIIIKQPNKL